MLVKTLLLAASLALPLPAAVSAATISADQVTAFLGPQPTGARRDVRNALGGSDGTFLSLGFGGSAVFSFGQAFTGPASFLEITWSERKGYLETARVFVGNLFDPKTSVFRDSDFTLVGDVTNASAASSLAFDGTWRYLALLDTSPRIKGRDGFDIDSVSVTTFPPAARLAPVPLPASGLLLIGGLAALLRCRRSRSV